MDGTQDTVLGRQTQESDVSSDYCATSLSLANRANARNERKLLRVRVI